MAQLIANSLGHTVKVRSEILPATPGVWRAIHVFTPCLAHRASNPRSTLAVMALRSSNHDYTRMKLYQHIECMGPADLRPMFDKPLPGTGGRGVAILFTEFPVQVWSEVGNVSPVWDTSDNVNTQELMEKIIAAMDGGIKLK